MFQMKYSNVKTIIITDDFISMKEFFVMLLKILRECNNYEKYYILNRIQECLLVQKYKQLVLSLLFFSW